jgi:hypothetical protein
MPIIGKKTGDIIIDDMVRKFKGIADNLSDGVELCEEEQEKNSHIIDNLAKRNGFLKEKTEMAKTFRSNLMKMFEKTEPYIKKEDKE